MYTGYFGGKTSYILLLWWQNLLYPLLVAKPLTSTSFGGKTSYIHYFGGKTSYIHFNQMIILNLKNNYDESDLV